MFRNISKILTSRVAQRLTRSRFTKPRAFHPSLARHFSSAPHEATTLRGTQRTPYKFEPGQSIHNFTLLATKEYPDFNLTMYTLEHTTLKTKVYHFDTDDTNNSFVYTFKTLPDNDKGKPHILEHLITCGSEKFPVRDPFMAMTKRSLNSYMNAWTGTDFTSYPFSTTNQADFENLLNVYTDMVFKPSLDYYDFLQEGWRYDFATSGDPNTELNYKGVVFNEMKGVYESGQTIFMEQMENNLLQGTPYGYSSGGRPEAITDLPYDELKAYYGKYYHPSNCVFYSYGDLDFTKTLKYIDENYLTNVKFLEVETDFGKTKLTKGIAKEFSVPPNPQIIDANKQTSYGVGFLLSDTEKNLEDTVGLNLLNFL
jgi:Zn-dependent M16 (insulinase) family peptidase